MPHSENPTLVSINISPLKRLSWNELSMETGICKRPVDKRVKVVRHAVEGDAIGDTKHHGGEYKAVYSYASEHYPYWHTLRNNPDLRYGQFGENLTTQGLDEAQLCIGDQLQIGETVLEVNQPRHPCKTLGLRFEDMDIVKQFLKSGRHGVYYRVIEEGTVGAGDAISIIYQHPTRIPVTDISRLYFDDKSDAEGLQKVLTIETLAPEWRERFEQQLASI